MTKAGKLISQESATPVVALLSVGERFGGVERHLIGMCEWFRRRGVDPILILFHDCELASQARSCGFSPIILSSRGSFSPNSPAFCCISPTGATVLVSRLFCYILELRPRVKSFLN